MAAACAAVQPDAELVKGLLSSVDCNVRSMTEAAYGSLAQPNSPMAAALTVMLTLYIAFIGYRLLIGRAPLRVSDFTLTALKLGVVLALATSWPTYQQLVFDTLFIGPEQLAGGMMDAVQPAAGSVTPLEGLQAAYDEMLVSAEFYSKRSLGLASPLQGGTAWAAMALNSSALLTLMISLGVVLAAKIVLGLLLGLGPMFVAFLLFDATRGLFEGWLRAAIALALAPLLAIFGLVVQLSFIEPHLLRLAELRTQGLVDLAPANAIFLLTLVSSGVSLALAVSVGVIAAGFRLPWSTPVAAASGETIRQADNRSSNVLTIDGRARTVPELQSRATTIAAAAAAIERRESRQVGEGGSARRVSVGVTRDGGPAPAAQAMPLGQSYRRAAQPKLAASNRRRDG